MKIAIFLTLVGVALAKSSDHEKVTCGSAIKLTHRETEYKLHSHAVQYGTGSGQQSITAFPKPDDPNSYFLVKAGHGDADCVRGTPIACGQEIRLLHMNTGKYLHSHLHKAPISRNQEVSGFDQANRGDNWKLNCVDSKHKYWMRDADVRLTHVETDQFLFASKKHTYSNPIPGQLEVSAVGKKSDQTVWIAQEGIYFSDNPNL